MIDTVQTFYRKYRPQKLSDLDNETVRTRIKHILSSSFRPHALLFSGSKGTGKTSTARIVAKLFVCEQQKQGEPCDTCMHCVAVRKGNHLDVLEIDAASNRGIEEIRSLREAMKLAPVSSTYKLYIIDEVHMLTKEAFNALLKTLEEPPLHTVFILATTEPEKIPETIRSRCLHIVFEKAKKEELLVALRRIVAHEQLDASDDVLEVIARVSDGSFRDATKILEQAAAEKALTLEKISALVGQGHGSGELLSYLFARNTEKALAQVARLNQEGADIRVVVTELLTRLHSLLLSLHGMKSDFREDNTGVSKQDVLALLKRLSQTYTELRSVPGDVPLVVAVVEWCEEGK